MDLDDDELRATRKLLGVDKCKFDKEDLTDYLINREDSIEYKTNSEIENLKSLLYADNITIHGKKELVKYYENEILRQKQRNEEHQKINGELREKVKELEKYEQMYLDELDKRVDIILLYNKLLKENKELKAKLEFKQWGDLDNIRFEEYMNEFVPKQRIIDFKNQIKLEPVIVGGRRNGKTLEHGIKLGKIKACEELLQQEDKKC